MKWSAVNTNSINTRFSFIQGSVNNIRYVTYPDFVLGPGIPDLISVDHKSFHPAQHWFRICHNSVWWFQCFWSRNNFWFIWMNWMYSTIWLWWRRYIAPTRTIIIDLEEFSHFCLNLDFWLDVTSETQFNCSTTPSCKHRTESSPKINSLVVDTKVVANDSRYHGLKRDIQSESELRALFWKPCLNAIAQ